MQLRQVRFRPFRLELRAPLSTARGLVRFRAGVLVAIEDRDGRVGLGEATPYPQAGTEGLPTCRKALRWMRDALEAHSVPEEPIAVDRFLERHSRLRRAPAARFALELALLDLIAQRRRVPLARLLSPTAAWRVPVSALLTGADPSALARETRRLAGRGFRVFKLKIGAGSLARDRERVAAVRGAAGPRARLRLDANGAFASTQAALAAFRDLERFRIEFCEEPLSHATPAALARLRRVSPIPIAADESLAVPGRARALVRRRAVDLLILKPMVQGGLVRALSLARRAGQAGIRSLVTTTIDGVVARLGAAHLAAALPGSRLASGLATGSLLVRDLGIDPCAIERGWLHLPRHAGLGFSLAEDR